MAKILIAEDTESLTELIRCWLENEHHIVETVDNGAEALDRARFYDYDVIVIDWGLPGMAGVDVCRILRQAGNAVPIIMLTAKKTMDEKETGFESGVDDYITKPFEMRELSARIKALLRRPRAIHTSVLRAGDLELEPESHLVTLGGQQIHLQPKEFKLLEFFIRHQGQIFSLEAILDRLWSADTDASVESVRKQITRLRSKIADQDKDSILKNIHGVGYKLEP
jgi:DNA-binding response OmpR family regulator